MNYKIRAIPRFEKDVKRLKKKFPKIKNDLLELVAQLTANPTIGTSLGEHIDRKVKRDNCKRSKKLGV